MGPAPALDFGDTGLAATGRTTMTDRAAGPTPGQQGTAPLAAPYDDDDLFRALGPHPSIGFILVHANGRDVYASERTRAIFGLGPEETPGERWRTLVHPADRDRVADRWAVAREGREFDEEYRVVRSDSTDRWVHVRAAPLHGGNGGVLAWAGTVEDVTARRSDERAGSAPVTVTAADARYQGLFEGAIDPILVADGSGRLVDANHTGIALLGYTREELLALAVTDVVARPPDWTEDEFARLMREGAWQGEFEMRRKDGSTVPTEVRAVRIVLPEGEVYLAAMRDITARRAVEAVVEERRRLARELHDSVSQVLYGIGLGAGVIREALGTDPELAAESADYVLSLVTAGTAELRSLIYELRPEALVEVGLVAALSEQATAVRTRHGLAVSATLGGEPDVPMGVKEALYRVAQEALHNAVRHARAERVALRLGATADGLALEVADDGIGFDPTAAHPGRVGMRSMRERVERLGGTLSIDSEPGRGTRVRAEVPIPAHAGATNQKTPFPIPFPVGEPPGGGRPAPAAAPGREGDRLAQERRRHVLVINRHAPFLTFCSVLLQGRGYAVTTTNPGPRTVAVLVALGPDAIVLDLGKGEPGDWELLVGVARDPRTAAIPLVVTSADAALLERAQAMPAAAGRRFLLLQPLAPADLIDAVRALTGPA
ncbi:MAG: hypothetical protein QOG89_3399 [Thermomicrobiales bacterium]|nr:hypothetical protein [Thermomicrobiales bacterium]